MTTPHVLIAAGVYPPDIGGPATFAVMLEAMLPRYDIVVSVLPFRTVRHLPKGIRHISYTYHLWKQTRHATHIFALDGVSVGLPAMIVSRLRRIPLIVRLGGDYAWEQGRARFGVTASLDDFDVRTAQFPVRVLVWLQRWVCQAATTVVVPSTYLKSMVVRWPLSPEKVRVIHSVFHAPEVMSPASTPTSRPYLVSAGRLVPWKGFALLIATVAALRVQIPTITLDIFGDGEERAALEQRIEDAGAQDYIQLRGMVAAPTLHAALATADVFVLNTGYEGLSHQLLEAMALRVPIVTTAIGGNQELLTADTHAVLYPYNDPVALKAALERILHDGELRHRLVTAAAEHVKDFSADAAGRAYASLFTT